jgi:hypothetical protein
MKIETAMGYYADTIPRDPVTLLHLPTVLFGMDDEMISQLK